MKNTRHSFYEWLCDQKYLRDDVIKSLFDHIRNIALSALVLGAAAYWIRNPTSDPEWLRTICILALSVGGLLFFMINFLHGVKRLGDAGISSVALVIAALVIYIPALGLFYQLLVRK